MLRLFYIFFLLSCISCSKDPATFNLVNLNNNEIGCFGHAGMGFYSSYSPNSWLGFESCLARGADGTEMDIHMTKDSVLIITHSSNLEESTSCSGAIKDLTWTEISDCKIKSKLFNDSKLLSLDEFIEKLENPKKNIFTWDCKLSDYNQEYYGVYARAIVNTFTKYDLGKNIFIENPFVDFLQIIKDKKNDANLFLLAEDFEEGLVQVKQSNFFGLSMNTSKISAEQVEKAHSKNIRVTIYGVLSEKENYAAIEKCPDYIQTDDLNYLLKVFEKYNRNKGFIRSLTN